MRFVSLGLSNQINLFISSTNKFELKPIRATRKVKCIMIISEGHQQSNLIFYEYRLSLRCASCHRSKTGVNGGQLTLQIFGDWLLFEMSSLLQFNQNFIFSIEYFKWRIVAKKIKSIRILYAFSI